MVPWNSFLQNYKRLHSMVFKHFINESPIRPSCCSLFISHVVAQDASLKEYLALMIPQNVPNKLNWNITTNAPDVSLNESPFRASTRVWVWVWLGNSCWGGWRWWWEWRRGEKRDRNCLHSKYNRKREEAREREGVAFEKERWLIGEWIADQVRRVICTNISLLRNG